MQTKQLIHLVRSALEDLKARDIVILDVRGQCSVTDYMVVASGSSNRHVKAVANNVVVDSKNAGVDVVGVEGLEGGEWALVDLGDVVVHVMQPQVRALYDLESLWTLDSAAEA